MIEIKYAKTADDMDTRCEEALTILVHLGYLTYDSLRGTVSIPNKEVSQEYVNAISIIDWKEVIQLAEGAISQIKNRQYVASLHEYKGNLLLAGINYDKESKTHTCLIEKVEV